MSNINSLTSKREKQTHRENLKKRMNIVVLSIVSVVVLGGITWAYAQSKATDSTHGSRVVSRYGVHWHPHLSILIKGKEVAIPPGIGLTGAVHNPIHTHDPDNIIHLEFEGRVTEKDMTLKKFFDLWGKDFSKDSLLGNVAGAEGKITMFVNNKENFEFENYHMKHGDNIKLIFE